ncbi:hypothetical protein AAAU16_06685 [Desulfovibrio piger]|uniref:hypothetical protein n=1 Tax=Desulfovibrio piger TaxID=901 RepID=UPI0032C11CB9
MPTDYTPKLQAAKAKLQAKGMLMQFVRRTEDTSQMPEPGGGYPVIETRTDFYGLKTSPMLAEVQMGIFAGEDLVVVMPGDVCEGRPDTTDKLSFLGQLWEISKIHVVAPAELDIIYKVAVKEVGGDA